MISDVYLRNCASFDGLEIVACADLDVDKAHARAREHLVPRACRVEELLDDPEIELVLNLTVPRAHGSVALAALGAGKSVYSEKPLATSRQEARQILELAKSLGLRVGCAPDTFLGGGLQTCRKLIDDGAIGQPVAATAFMMNHGHEHWHPEPTFYYQPGGGPMLDMGPYYLTALISLMGPVRRVAGSTSISFPERTVTSKPGYGERIQVNTPTHIAGVMDFENGAVGTIVTSFDVWAARLPHIEIYGTEGTLSLPDPNTFGGPVHLWRPDRSSWTEIPLTHGHTANCRGIGVADMATALRSGREHRASGELAYHTLDVIEAFYDSSRSERHIHVTSTCDRPAPAEDPSSEN